MSNSSLAPLGYVQFSADVLIFTLKDNQLHLALVKRQQDPFKGAWSLPGSFVHTDVDMDLMGAVRRCLQEKLHLQGEVFVEQLGTVGSAVRDPRGWSASVAYVGLCPFETLHEQACWFNVKELPELPFDHGTLVRMATERIKNKASYSALGVYALRSPFTLTQLQKTYEALLGQKQNVRTFRRKVEELKMVEPLKKSQLGAHRPAGLFEPSLKLKEHGLLVGGKLFEG